MGDLPGMNPEFPQWSRRTHGPIVGGVRVFPKMIVWVALALAAAGPSRSFCAAPPTAGLETALRDANALAGHYPGSKVVRVSGNSMVPFFSDGAVLVIRPVAFEAMRPGVIAAYVNRFGETIVHRVTKATPNGWQVRGFNNRQADSTLINSGNLIGAVYAIFHPHSSAPAKDVAQLTRLIAQTPSALAAPAR